jgi:transcriptional regulator with XRE-family HTH domain
MKAPHPNDVLVGANIRVHRMAIRMSQVELGEQLGVTFQQIQKYEKGTNRVGAGRLVTISSVLNVPITSFFEGSKTQTHGKQQPVLLLRRRDAFALAEAFDKITGKHIRQALVAFVVSLSER